MDSYSLLTENTMCCLWFQLLIKFYYMFSIFWQWQVKDIKKCNFSSWHCEWLHTWNTWRSIFFLSLRKQSYYCRSFWFDWCDISGGTVYQGTCKAIVGCSLEFSNLWCFCFLELAWVFMLFGRALGNFRLPIELEGGKRE